MDRIDRIIKESIDKVVNEANNFSSHGAKMKATANAMAKERGIKVGDVFNAMNAKNAAFKDINKELASKRRNSFKDKISSAVLPDTNPDDVGILSTQRMRDADDYFNSENEFYRPVNNDTFGNVDRLGYLGDLDDDI